MVAAVVVHHRHMVERHQKVHHQTRFHGHRERCPALTHHHHRQMVVAAVVEPQEALTVAAKEVGRALRILRCNALICTSSY